MHPNDNKWATPVSVGDFFLSFGTQFSWDKNPKE